MRAWNASYKHHHIPTWGKKLLKARFLMEHPFGTRGRESTGGESVLWNFHRLWDHWGSVQINYMDYLITQPYGDETFIPLMERWCAKYAMRIAFPPVLPAPWAPGTILFLLRPAYDIVDDVFPKEDEE